MKVTSMPNMKLIADVLREEMGESLIDLGRFLVKDVVTCIRGGVDLQGGTQKANSPAWAKHKQKKKGHTTPLLYDEVLANPARYTLNGAGAATDIAPPQNLRVLIRLPTNRIVIVARLLALGYRVPWGISTRTREKSKTLMGEAFARARARLRSARSGAVT